MTPAAAVPDAATPRRDDRPAAGAGLAALLFALTLAAYLPALDNQFIWDDDNYVTANPTLLDADGLRRIWLEPGAAPQYYPLTFTSFWLEYHLWELDPFGYHLVNVLLHGLAAVLFWRVLVALQVPGAWLAAAIFALHPINVESVAWITERKNVLSGACYLGAALAYLRYSPPRSTAAGSRGWYALALVLFTAAVLSKTVTCSLPAALLLVLWWARGRVDRRDVVALAPFFALGLLAAGMTAWLEREHVGAQGADWAFSAVERGLIAGRALWFYLWTLTWPTGLTFIYPRWQIDAGAAWQYAFPAAALLAAATLWGLRRRLGTGPLVAALFYAGTLVPALGFVNVYPMRYAFVADHFAYLATLGPIALVAGAAATLLARLRVAPATARGLAAALLAVLALLTWNQSEIYRDPETLWSDTVAKNPEGWAGLVNLGGVLADQGRLDEAIAHMQTAVRLWPAAPESHNALGAMWDQQGRFDEAAAAFAEALRLEPRYYEAHTNLGIVLASQGKPEQAAEHLFTAVRLKPRYVDAYYHLATTLLLLDRRSEAAKYLATALRLAPDHAAAHERLCAIQIDQGRLDEAERHCREAIRLDDASPEAHESLARALDRQGRSDEARGAMEQASRLRRGLADAHRTAGILLAEQGKHMAAIAQLREALRLVPDDSAARTQLQDLLAREP